MNVNVWDVTDPIQALIRSRQVVDAPARRPRRAARASSLAPSDGAAA